MNRIFTRLGFTAAALVAGSAIVAHAQTATTGAVSGTVVDGKAALVAGATVRLSSAQTSRTAVTGADGTFRMGLLNPGTWTIEVTKAGLQKFTQTVTVFVNSTQPMNIKMASEAATVVEVIGSAATIDTTTTQTGLTTTMDNLAAIPKGRDMSSVAFLAPGVVASGFGTDPSIGGGSGAENSYIVDGLSTTNTARGFQGASLVTDFIDQVEVQTGGFKPEFSALGGVFNAITKSGTNEVKGSTWLTWDAIGIQAVPKKSIYAKQGAPNSRYDIGGEVSGPIIKDKLFFFVGVDANKVEATAGLPNNIGLVDGDRTVDTIQAIAKINWYITQDHQITFSANLNDAKDDYPTRYPVTGNAALGYSDKNTTQNFVLNYDWTISPSLFFSAKAGSTQYKDDFAPTDSTSVAVTDNIWYTVGPGAASRPDLAGFAYRYGGAGYYVSTDKVETTQIRADLSWFLGTHNLKFGISQLDSDYTEIAATSGGHRDTIRSNGGAFNGVDQQYLHTNATVKATFQALYAQDTWDVGAGVKLMYGIRYEIQDQKDLNGKSFMKFDSFADYYQPRLGFTWDVNQDGKTKVAGSYAKYFEMIPQRIAIRVFANETYLRNRYSTARSTYNPATGAYAITNPTPSSITDFATPFSFDPIAENIKLPERNEYTLGVDHTLASGWTAGVHGKYRTLKNPIEDSVITDPQGLPYDPGAAIRVGQVWGTYAPADTISAYGYFGGQAILWNPGHYVAWTSRDISGIPNQRFAVNNTLFEDHAGNNFQSLDFTLDKKTDRDVFSFSYTWSRLQGNYEGVVSSSNGQADGNITASFDYNPYVGYGLLPLDRTNVIKMYFSHRFDLAGGDLNLGANWTYQSGTPISLFDDGSTTNGHTPGYDTVNSYWRSNDPVVQGIGMPAGTFNGYWVGDVNDPAYYTDKIPFHDLGGYGNATPANGQLGQYGRTPALNNVDAHIDWAYKMGKRYKLIPSVDIFNLFNTRYATGVFQAASDNGGNQLVNYGQANNWQTGRRYRFGVKFQF